MDVNEISPSKGDGEAILEQENKMDINLTAQCDRGNQPTASNSFDLVTERWIERAIQTEGLELAMQQWCERDFPAIQDLNALAPCLFANECTTPDGEECSSTLCQAVTALKASCQSFLEYKDAYAVARAAHADAVKKLNDIRNQSTSSGVCDQDDASSELLAASFEAKLVAEKAKNASRDAEGQQTHVYADANAVALKTKMISQCHYTVRCNLQGLRPAGNETSLVTKQSQASDASKKRLLKPDLDTLRSLCEVEFYNVDFLPVLDEEHVRLLAPFYAHLKRGFGTASVLASNDEKYSLKIDETVNAIIGWNVDDNPSTGSSTIQFVAPGCVGQELAGVHPILYAIMFKMTQVLGLEQHVIHEQRMQAVETCSVRCVDFVVSPLAEEYLASTPPALLRLPVEAKPVARMGAQVRKLLQDALNQVLGHLAKKAMFFFDFGGIGEDCTVVGLALNMGSVVVVVLELLDVGTERVRINTKRTKHAPLFDKETGKNLFDKKASEVEALFDKHVNEQQGMPAGFCLLARALMSAQIGLGTSLMKRSEECRDTFVVLVDNAEPIEAGCYLGSGAHSHVLKLNTTGSDDQFIKIPRCHQMTEHLLHEARVLQKVRRHGNIPQLHDVSTPISTFRINIRCERADLVCLRLKGIIGQPTSQKRKWRSCDLKVIFSGVYDALNSVHKEGWTHLDVRPANIIVTVDNSGHVNKVMLIDWGRARHNSTKEKTFLGSLQFAHDELFGLTKPWTPSPNHDLASLVYSIASLSLGSIPWSGFSNHHELTVDVRNRRNEMASNRCRPLFEDWALSPEFSEELLNSISSGECKSRKRAKVGEISPKKLREPRDVV
jgi:serine/threonine protein kinase